MKHHAAALALLCGRYLMMPPINRDPLVPADADMTAPLTKWTQDGSFDSAAECKREQGRYRDEMNKPAHHEHYKGEDDRRTFSLCIASDDPRLKVK